MPSVRFQLVSVASMAVLLCLSGCSSQPSLTQQPEPARSPAEEQQRLLSVAHDVEAQGNTSTAALMYKNALALSPDDQPLALQTGNAQLRAQDYASAEKTFRAILYKDLSQADALLGLGTAQLYQGDLALAVRNLRAAAPKLNTHTGWVRLGVAEELAGNPSNAVQAFEKDLALTPQNPDVQTNLALAEALAKRYTSAMNRMQEVCGSPLAESRHFRTQLLIMVLSGQTRKARTTDFPTMSPTERNQLILKAHKISALNNSAKQAQALGLLSDNA